MGCIKNNSLFKPTQQHIKFYNEQIIAVEGPNIMEKMLLSDLRIPYKQILRGRVILKPGQVNYLLNFLGLGDNATFLSLKATYDVKSKDEKDNYVKYFYFDNIGEQYAFNQMLVLTGNSSNRIKQLYLSNPNLDYPISIDIMVAIIDDSTSFFPDIDIDGSSVFDGLTGDLILGYSPQQTFRLMDKDMPSVVQGFFNFDTINSFERIDKVIKIDDQAIGNIQFVFLTEQDALEGMSRLSWLLENNSVNIPPSLNAYDTISPLVIFATSSVYYLDIGSSTYISATNSKQVVDLGVEELMVATKPTAPVPTLSGYDPLFIGNGATVSYTFSQMKTAIFTSVYDVRDGIMAITPFNTIVTAKDDISQTPIFTNFVTTSPTYFGEQKFLIKFNLEDIAGNPVDNNNDADEVVIEFKIDIV